MLFGAPRVSTGSGTRSACRSSSVRRSVATSFHPSRVMMRAQRVDHIRTIRCRSVLSVYCAVQCVDDDSPTYSLFGAKLLSCLSLLSE